MSGTITTTSSRSGHGSGGVSAGAGVGAGGASRVPPTNVLLAPSNPSSISAAAAAATYLDRVAPTSSSEATKAAASSSVTLAGSHSTLLEPPKKRPRKPFRRMVYTPNEQQLAFIPPREFVQIFIPVSVVDEQIMKRGGMESLPVYGTDVYTHESHLVGAAVHSGALDFAKYLDYVYSGHSNAANQPAAVASTSSAPTIALSAAESQVRMEVDGGASDTMPDVGGKQHGGDRITRVLGISMCLKILDPPKHFRGSYRNGVTSHDWDSYTARAFEFDSVLLYVRTAEGRKMMVPCGGARSPLIELTTEEVERLAGIGKMIAVKASEGTSKRPGAEELGLDWQAISSAFKSPYINNVSIVFNLSNEPCVKYTLGAICDRGYSPTQRTSFHLLTEVLYLESESARYELTAVETRDANGQPIVRYRWSRVVDPSAVRNTAAPLDEPHVQVLHDGLEWCDLEWGPHSVRVRSDDFPLARLFFVPRQSPLSVLQRAA